MTDDIVAFIRARLDEDERTASAVHLPGPWTVSPTEGDGLPSGVWVDDASEEGVVVANGSYIAAHVARHEPARVLRGVAAKRRIVDEHAIVHRNIGWLEDGDEAYDEIPVCGRCTPKHSHFPSRTAVPEGYCREVRLLASEWSDHQGYRQEWTP